MKRKIYLISIISRYILKYFEIGRAQGFSIRRKRAISNLNHTRHSDLRVSTTVMLIFALRDLTPQNLAFLRDNAGKAGPGVDVLKPGIGLWIGRLVHRAPGVIIIDEGRCDRDVRQCQTVSDKEAARVRRNAFR